MIEMCFELLRHVLTLSFGIAVSSNFLNIKWNKRNSLILLCYGIIDLSIQGLVAIFVGFSVAETMYPVITHIPLLLLYVLCYKKRWLVSAVAITTGYLCCQIANWISIITGYMSIPAWGVDLSYSLCIIVTYIIIIKYVSSPLSGALIKSKQSILSFSVIPIFYYVFDYVSTVYTELLYIGKDIAVEFPPFLLSIAYIAFCAIYFKQYEETQEIESRNRLIEIRDKQSQKEISSVKHSEKKISLLKHDMRHLLNTIYGYIEIGEVEKAQSYIKEISNILEDVSPQKYCNNDTINYIISFYSDIMEENDIEFDCSVSIPSKIEIPDVDITSILSNGLENAFNEVMGLDRDDRKIELHLVEKHGKILISLENTYKKKPVIVDGIPVSDKRGHGLGTQSIQYTAEKLNGNCYFYDRDRKFLMQVIL